jgi:fused signal recognition particle receptor
MARLLRRTGDIAKRTLWQRIKDIALADVTVLARGGVQPGSLEALEEVLLEADFGVPVTLRLVSDVERLATRGEVKTEAEFFGALRGGIADALRAGNSDPSLTIAAEKPTVIVVIGVNGSGKTTFVAKLAARLRSQGQRVMVAAADTFRAGAIDQLRLWAERTRADFVGGQPGGDPAAVAFDAVEAASTRGADVVIIDTAGRLHTSGGLMEELRKVVRVVKRRRPDAPHETLLVLDATIGQNAVQQAKTFADAVPVSGLVMTKVDGTAKGGIVVAVHEAIDAPVKFLGTGEQVGDLEAFDAEAFAGSVLEE